VTNPDPIPAEPPTTTGTSGLHAAARKLLSLPLWEREPRRPAGELFERVRRTEGLPRILPLPLGEGRGEGNWSRKKPRALYFCNRLSDFGFRISDFVRTATPHALLVCGALLLTGCAGYQLGPTNGLAAGEKSVQIAPFVNATLQPRLTDYVTSQLRKELQKDGTYRLATHGDADIILSGRMTRYDRSEVTLSSADILTVRDYRLVLTAQVTARERSTGRMLLDQSVTGSTLIRVGPDLTSAERQAMPLLADDLAKNVTALLADGKW